MVDSATPGDFQHGASMEYAITWYVGLDVHKDSNREALLEAASRAIPVPSCTFRTITHNNRDE